MGFPTSRTVSWASSSARSSVSPAIRASVWPRKTADCSLHSKNASRARETASFTSLLELSDNLGWLVRINALQHNTSLISEALSEVYSLKPIQWQICELSTASDHTYRPEHCTGGT